MGVRHNLFTLLWPLTWVGATLSQSCDIHGDSQAPSLLATRVNDSLMILLIDNYDSFTYNLVQYFGALGEEVLVRRNDAITLAEIAALAPSHLVISPGPCTPNEAGISLAAIRHFADSLPILGVCLGISHLAQAFGAQVVRAQRVMHGKTSLIEHDGQGVFAGFEPAVTGHPLPLVDRGAAGSAGRTGGDGLEPSGSGWAG